MRLLLSCALLLPLAACTTTPLPPAQSARSAAPPTTADVLAATPGAVVVAPAGGSDAPRPQPVPAPRPALADGASVPAVQGLLDAAERARRAGDLATAGMHLERAQRLAPQSALVFQRLADLRLQQRRPAEAEQFARKGLSFAGSSGQQALLWRLVAEARRQQGRSDAALEALQRAQQLEMPVP